MVKRCAANEDAPGLDAVSATNLLGVIRQAALSLSLSLPPSVVQGYSTPSVRHCNKPQLVQAVIHKLGTNRGLEFQFTILQQSRISRAVHMQTSQHSLIETTVNCGSSQSLNAVTYATGLM